MLVGVGRSIDPGLDVLVGYLLIGRCASGSRLPSGHLALSAHLFDAFVHLFDEFTDPVQVFFPVRLCQVFKPLTHLPAEAKLLRSLLTTAACPASASAAHTALPSLTAAVAASITRLLSREQLAGKQ